MPEKRSGEKKIIIMLQKKQKLRHYKFTTTTYCIIYKNIISNDTHGDKESSKQTFFTFFQPSCLVFVL
ncbi:MAG TPA: hypothetical protein DD405_07400 [Desulfobacteraceae bacterium]|nr:hypothetical protein [Desulfobacteraceae bacterium]